MTPIQAILAKELRTAFVSPIVYVVGVVFLFSVGILSYVLIQYAGTLVMQQMQFQAAAAELNLNDLVFRQTFDFMGFWLFLMLLPILTMRVFAEEHKLRTFELLATSPIHITDVVIGKFLSVYVIFLGLLSLTITTPLILSLFSSFTWDPLFTGYLGLALLGALFLATGVFASTLTENQIVAVLLSFGLLFTMLLLGVLGANLGDSTVGNILSYLSYSEHFDRLVRGLLDTKDVVYFVSGTVLMLFLAHRVMESQRWT